MVDAIEALVQALAQRVRDRWYVVPGVGWLTVKLYKAYVGINPRTGESVSVPDKWDVFFFPDRSLSDAIVGSQSSGVAAADDRLRFLHALHGGSTDDDDEDPITVTRTADVDAIAEAVHRRLLAGEAADIPGLGVFERLEHPSREGRDPDTGAPIIIPARVTVRFVAEQTLNTRLNKSVT